MATSEALARRSVPANQQGRLPACLYCGETNYVPLYEGVEDRLRHVPGVWAFWSCQGCGSAMLRPHPRPEDLAAFYPAVYGFVPGVERAGTLRRALARAEYRWFFRPQYAAQARRVLRGIRWGGEPGQRLLDVGCGRGLRLRAFQERGFDVQGMDFQQEVVEYVRQELGIPAQACAADQLGEHFPSECFDVVTAFYVLEHVPDVRAVLRACRDVLRPGGWFVAGVPLVDGLQVRLFGRRWVGVTEAPRHLSLPSRYGLAEACRRAGFVEVFVRPDAALACASHIGLSLFPGAATSHVYGEGGVGRLGRRLAAGAATLMGLPWCFAGKPCARPTSAGLRVCTKAPLVRAS